jgi:hypothetical protein
MCESTGSRFTQELTKKHIDMTIQTREWRTKLGKLRRIRLFGVWCSLRNRCLSKSNKDYRYYGSRGIGICGEWRQFDRFRKWALISGYRKGLTIDRKDNDEGYLPSNCQWVTRLTQNQNRRASLSMGEAVEVCMSKQPRQKLCSEYGISLSTFHRITNGDWFRP